MQLDSFYKLSTGDLRT